MFGMPLRHTPIICSAHHTPHHPQSPHPPLPPAEAWGTSQLPGLDSVEGFTERFGASLFSAAAAFLTSAAWEVRAGAGGGEGWGSARPPSLRGL